MELRDRIISGAHTTKICLQENFPLRVILISAMAFGLLVYVCVEVFALLLNAVASPVALVVGL